MGDAITSFLFKQHNNKNIIKSGRSCSETKTLNFAPVIIWNLDCTEML